MQFPLFNGSTPSVHRVDAVYSNRLGRCVDVGKGGVGITGSHAGRVMRGIRLLVGVAGVGKNVSHAISAHRVKTLFVHGLIRILGCSELHAVGMGICCRGEVATLAS